LLSIVQPFRAKFQARIDTLTKRSNPQVLVQFQAAGNSACLKQKCDLVSGRIREIECPKPDIWETTPLEGRGGEI
jgi:hypothetical protein